MKLIGLLILVIVLLCGYSYLTDKAYYEKWAIEKKQFPDTSIAWASFIWTNDTLNGIYYEKTSMQIPCKVEGLPYNFTFQFDLGAGLTGIYENSIRSLYTSQPNLKNRIGRIRSRLQFWNNKKGFEDLTILFGDYKASNRMSYYYPNYGDELPAGKTNLTDTFHLGTIGADLFQGKTLLIDYPNKRFAICDTVPASVTCRFTDIQLDQSGRVLLPLYLKGKNFTAMFDNGSSLFPLLVTDDKIDEFSTLPTTDTFKINAWGRKIVMTGRILNDSFNLAGQGFNQTMVYADPRQDYRTDKYDAVTGNTLFWDKMIVIDFKNRRFGVQ